MIASVILATASTATLGCDLANVGMARATYEALARRAVEVVAATSSDSVASDARLNALVDQSASFDLGGGDVGRPLGEGALGARALAAMMMADQYRFLGLDYMDGPANACVKQTVKVDFISATENSISQVEFTFDRGRVVGAHGWQRSFTSGALPRPEHVTNGN